MAASVRNFVVFLTCLVMAAHPTVGGAQTEDRKSAAGQTEADAIKTGTPTTEAPPSSLPPQQQPTQQQQSEEPSPYNPLDTYSFYLTALFIGFGLIVILMQLAAMRRIETITADEIARNCAITLVVVASVALLVSGYSSQQVAPAFGLFGTIIGYLLGKASKREEQDAPPAKKP